MEISRGKALSVFSLVMINVIAVDSLRTLSISAEYGFSLVFYYLAAAVIFFIPTALVAAELATTWPKTGGLYVWVREAFGGKIGFLAIWLQWIYNVVWYPTILAFIGASVAYLIDPQLAHNKVYVLTIDVLIFSLATFINLFGIRISSFVSIVGAIVGTLLPMGIIIILGIIWIQSGKPMQIDFSWQTVWPDFDSVKNLVLLTGVLFGLVGMEMSAVHAGDVKKPQRDYPHALLYSTVLILASLIFASLAIAIVIPQHKLSLVSGLLDAFNVFFKAFQLGWMEPILDLLIIIGAVCSISTWVIGPTRGLLIATKDSGMFPHLSKVNRFGAPQNILMLQFGIFLILCSVFIFMPTVNSSYWILSALTAQLAMIVYLLMFAACVYLRYQQPDIERPFKIPGGTVGLYLVSGIGFITCLGAIAVGFFPPSQFDVGNIWTYEIFLVLGIIILAIPPLIFGTPKKHPETSS